MRYTIAVLLVLFMFGFGCLEESSFLSTRSEHVTNSQEIDLDGDGNVDYMIYDFSPVTLEDGSMTVQRKVTVSTETDGTYWRFNENLTDVDLLLADESLDEFSKSKLQADSACSQEIGLSNVVCSDVATCSKLCSAASLKCKRIAANYDDALAGAMISYVQSNNDIRTTLIDARRRVLNLREGSDEEKDEFLDSIQSMISRVAEINANPLYTHPEFMLCTHSDFGITYLLEAAETIGDYEVQTVSYNYNVLLSAKPTDGSDIAKIIISDRMPRSVVGDSDRIGSIQDFTASQDSSMVAINWTSTRPNQEGYIFHYSFSSEEAPAGMVAALQSPDIRLSRVNLAVLAPFLSIQDMMLGMTGNYFVSLGFAAGVCLSFLFFTYTVIMLLFTVISERAGGSPITKGFRRAFGRTDVRWKTDLVISAVLLVLGYYISAALVAAPATIPTLLETLEFLAMSGWGVVGASFVMLGVVVLYFAAENVTKITILERAYGMVIKQERDLFLVKVASLKDQLAELTQLVEEYSKENFDVGKEYDVLAVVKADKVDLLAKDMNARSKARIEEYLSRVETALASLKQRKKLADENWPKWKESIGKTLDEQGEVYVSTLVTIPASLRAWVLEKYMEEEGAGALSLDRDVLKKKKVSAGTLVQDLIGKDLMRGVVVMKQGKVEISEFKDGGGTVLAALSVKLVSYMRSMARNLGQHEPSSFVSVGDKMVVVMMKNRNLQSVLFVNKPKFKEAIEMWKSKVRALE